MVGVAGWHHPGAFCRGGLRGLLRLEEQVARTIRVPALRERDVVQALIFNSRDLGLSKWLVNH